MRREVLALVAAGSLAVGACQPGGGDVSKSVLLTSADSGRTVRLHTSDFLILTLDANASTGFRWVTTDRPDPRVLDLVASDFVAPTAGPVGAPGQELWRFRAVGEGSTSLRLTYEHPTGEAGGQSFRVMIEVSPGG